MSGAMRALAGTLRARRSSLTLERALPVGVAGLVALASFLSVMPGTASSPIGGTTGAGSDPRLVVGGATGLDRVPAALDPDLIGVPPLLEGDNEVEGRSFRPLVVPAPIDSLPDTPGTLVPGTVESEQVDGHFLADGTLVTAFAPSTTVADGSSLFRRYRVRSGDTLTGIASQFGVSMMTVWWANDLKSKSDLVVGKVLTIPPVSGLVVDVVAGDTLDALSAKYRVDKQDILAANGLTDPNLVVGQTLILPGALGESIKTPKPKPVTTKPSTSGSGSDRGGGGGGGGGSVRPPATYSGGAMSWPVVGGGNYVSQYYRNGHYGIDIAADYGSRVRAAAGGRVIFAGWKSNGGGYQVWIAHGSGLYTTYNHMAGVSVARGQSVSRGQQVGRVGSSGNSTGPHLHFEVWRGEIWNGGTRVNPLGYF